MRLGDAGAGHLRMRATLLLAALPAALALALSGSAGGAGDAPSAFGAIEPPRVVPGPDPKPRELPQRAGIYDEANRCINTSIAGRLYPPLENSIFEVRLLGSSDRVPRTYGAQLQEGLVGLGVQRKYFEGLGVRPSGYPPRRIPIYLTPGAFDSVGNSGLTATTCANRAVHAILVRADQRARGRTATHELFHAHAYWKLGKGGTFLVPWWEEASAAWAETKVGYPGDRNYNGPLQFPETPLDKVPGLHQYAMYRFVQFLDDRGLIGGGDWVLQREVISDYESPGATQGLANALAARGTTLAYELGAFWGDRLKEKPSHGPGLERREERTTRLQPGNLTVLPSAAPLATWFMYFLPAPSVDRVTFEFEPTAPSTGHYWGGVTAQRSERFQPGDIISFCVAGPDEDDLAWPTRGFPVTFTNGQLSGPAIQGEIEILAQSQSGQCTSPFGNLACQVLNRINIDALLGTGRYPFSSEGDRQWRCVFVNNAETKEIDLIVTRVARDVSLRELRRRVKRALEEGGFDRIRVGDVAGIIRTDTEDTVVYSVYMLVGREIHFFSLYNDTRTMAIRIAKRIVGERG